MLLTFDITSLCMMLGFFVFVGFALALCMHKMIIRHTVDYYMETYEFIPDDDDDGGEPTIEKSPPGDSSPRVYPDDEDLLNDPDAWKRRGQ